MPPCDARSSLYQESLLVLSPHRKSDVLRHAMTHACVFVYVFVCTYCQVNKKFVEISKVQCLQAAVNADNKTIKAAADQGPSSTTDHPFEGKAYVQVGVSLFVLFCR